MDEERPICSVEGCHNKAHSRGWCMTHYGRWWRHGDVQTVLPSGPPPIRTSADRRCSISGCYKHHYGKGYCERHYRHFKAYGDPLLGTFHGDSMPCMIEGCERNGRSTGLCKVHYERARRYDTRPSNQTS